MSHPPLYEEETNETEITEEGKEFWRGLVISALITLPYVALIFLNGLLILNNDLSWTPLAWSYPFFALFCSPVFEYFRLKHKNHGDTTGSSNYFWGSLIPVAIIVILWFLLALFAAWAMSMLNDA